MSILPTAPSPGNRAAPPHDPLVCGIDRESSCSACRSAFDPPAPPRTLWRRLLRRFPILRRLTRVGVLTDYVPPPRPDDTLLLAVVALLADDERRRVILAAISADVAMVARAAVGKGASP
jgi:hypothetical protein